MARKLSVFSGSVTALIDGKLVQCACVMATTSKTQFCKVTGMRFTHVTGGGTSTDLAMAQPETLLINKNGMNYPREYVAADVDQYCRATIREA